MIPTLVVHGGAGTYEDDRIPAATAGVAAAARAGLAVLLAGGRALDAAQVAVAALEEDPEFNAGIGGSLTRVGTLEVDAAIMDGETLRVGALGAMEHLRHPVALARKILEDGEHVLLVGPAAWEFAREQGITPVASDVLITERARRRLADELERRRNGGAVRPAGGGTVGACAIDRSGHTAAATSTGGTTCKRPGRVGDSPLPGCGTYADDRGGAASATGHGESLIRVLTAGSVVELLRQGRSAREAAWLAIDELEARIGGKGGVICVDAQGRVGVAHNTQRMAFAHASEARPEPVAGVVAPRR